MSHPSGASFSQVRCAQRCHMAMPRPEEGGRISKNGIFLCKKSSWAVELFKCCQQQFVIVHPELLHGKFDSSFSTPFECLALFLRVAWLFLITRVGAKLGNTFLSLPFFITQNWQKPSPPQKKKCGAPPMTVSPHPSSNCAGAVTTVEAPPCAASTAIS